MSETPETETPAFRGGRAAALLERIRQVQQQQQQPKEGEDRSCYGGGGARSGQTREEVIDRMRARRQRLQAAQAKAETGPDLDSPRRLDWTDFLFESIEEDTRITLKTNSSLNYVKLNLIKAGGFFEYEVTFQPQLKAKNARFACLNKVAEKVGINKARTFDGFTLCLPQKLERDVTVIQCENSCEYLPYSQVVKVSINFMNHRSFGHSSAIDLYNNLFRKIMKILKFVEMKRNNYDPLKRNQLPALRLEVWPGYVNTVSEREDGLYLICDVSSNVLCKETVLDVIEDLYHVNKNKGHPEIVNSIKRALLGESVVTRFNNKHYVIDDIDFSKNPTDTFVNARGEEVSFAQFYQDKFNLVLRDWHQPLLLNIPKKQSRTDMFWDDDRIICLMPELCFITRHSDEMRNDSRLTRLTSPTPGERNLLIKGFLARVQVTHFRKPRML